MPHTATYGPIESYWDDYWEGHSCGLDDDLLHRFYRQSIWNGYMRALDGLGLKEPRILELGCGTGYKTARMIQHLGGDATLVDFSENALSRARDVYGAVGIESVSFVKQDIRHVSYVDEFDLVHSEGVIEHFEGEELDAIVGNHCRAVKDDGFVFIFVPLPTWYYRLWRWGLTASGRWPFGYEEPMGEGQLVSLMEERGMDIIRTVRAGRFLGVVAKRADN